MQEGILKFLLDLLESFVIALAIFVVVYNFIAQPHRVRGDSMTPNYHNDEYLLTEKLSYRFGEPERGDVVVLKFPDNTNIDYIKRIVALPGETLELRNGNVYINGQLLNEPYLSSQVTTHGNNEIRDHTEFNVPENSYVVMGDNRSRSSDSRSWGTVPRDYLVGRAFFVYWPLPDLGLIKDQYPHLSFLDSFSFLSVL